MRTLALLLMLICTPVLIAEQIASAPVLMLTQEGAIGPASADYLHRGFIHAAAIDAQLIVIRLDTPGGLDLSMRAIIKDILASNIPVVCFVAPRGARAASAGTYILYACHISAMAPATNVGAATPISIGPSPPSMPPNADATRNKSVLGETDEQTLKRKQTNDAAAYIRGLAQLRGRNADWAERAVREAVSLSSKEAQEQHVVDVIAADLPQLLRQLDGRQLTVLGREHHLVTARAATLEFSPDWRARVLITITDPNIAYLLLLIGFYGLVFEFLNPGLVAPGVLGGICLLLGLFALQMLPVNYAGLGLMVLGIGLMVAEHFVVGFGVLGLGGIVAFTLGSIMLIDTDVPGFGVAWPVIAGASGASALLLLLVLGLALRSRGLPVVSGREAMIGAVGEVIANSDGVVFARVLGEQWRVRTETPEASLQLVLGQRIRVLALDGLLLTVEVLSGVPVSDVPISDVPASDVPASDVKGDKE